MKPGKTLLDLSFPICVRVNCVRESVRGPRGWHPGMSQGFLKRTWVGLQRGADSWVAEASEQPQWPLQGSGGTVASVLKTAAVQGQLAWSHVPCRQLHVMFPSLL